MHAEAVARRRLDFKGRVQPVGGAEALQAFRQLAGFELGQHRVPQRVSAGREALQGFLQAFDDGGVVVFRFIRRVDQHQRAARRWRQQGLEPGKAVPFIDRHLATGALEAFLQQLDVGAVHLVQTQAVGVAQQLAGQPR